MNDFDYVFKVEKDWITKAGLRAICVLILDSHRCGYVEIGKNHPLSGADYSKIEFDFDVHGNLTFSGDRSELVDSNNWWFGFDCAHLVDGLLFQHSRNKGVKTTEFVVDECEKLAEQLENFSSKIKSENK